MVCTHRVWETSLWTALSRWACLLPSATEGWIGTARGESLAGNDTSTSRVEQGLPPSIVRSTHASRGRCQRPDYCQRALSSTAVVTSTHLLGGRASSGNAANEDSRKSRIQVTQTRARGRREPHTLEMLPRPAAVKHESRSAMSASVIPQ